MGFTKIDLIKKVARSVEALVIDSTLATPTADTFNDKRLAFQNAEQLEGKQVYVYGAPTFTPVDAVIKTFVPGAVPTIRTQPTLSTIPTAGQAYLILDYYKIDELKEAVEDAIKAAGKFYLIPATTTITLIATQYEYTVPSGLNYVNRLHFIPTLGTDFAELDNFPIPRGVWWIQSKKIVFNPELIDLDDYDKKRVRVCGQGRPPLLELDDATYDDILEEYLVAWATRKLCVKRIAGGGEADPWLQKYIAARVVLEEERPRITTGVNADTERVN